MPLPADLAVASLLACLLGFVSGLLAGLLGIGGGIVLVPGLSALLAATVGLGHDTAIKVAVATSLAIIGFTALSSMRAHHQRGAVRWSWVAWLAPGIVLGSLAAAQVARRLPADALVVAFSAFVLLSAQRLWRGGGERDDPARAAETGQPSWAAALTRLAGGFAIGAAAALVGAGGAFISVPYLRHQRVSIHEAIGTSAALGLPVALTGALAHAWAGMQDPDTASRAGFAGYVHLPSLAASAFGAVLAAPLGARLAHALDRRRLERGFSCLLVMLACWMLWRTASH